MPLAIAAWLPERLDKEGTQPAVLVLTASVDAATVSVAVSDVADIGLRGSWGGIGGGGSWVPGCMEACLKEKHSRTNMVFM
jgi:hypothetical protein